jgi:hypothetical protein
MLGVAKGSVRILPGPRHQVLVTGNSQTPWTTVSLSQFRLWQSHPRPPLAGLDLTG